MYRYGEFEDLLTSLHGIPAQSRPTLRARIKYYRRLKMFGDVRGDRNVSYTFEDLVFWAFMIEIAQFGLDPQRLVQIAWAVWPYCKEAIFSDLSHVDDDLFFAARPIVLSSSILEDERNSESRVSGITPLDSTKDKYTFLRSELRSRLPARGIILNLSELYRRVEAAAEHFEKVRTDVHPQA